MTLEDALAALDLPTGVRNDLRLPKKTLIEQGARSAADRRYLHDGVDEAHWHAALKPTTVGIPAFRDERREYGEIVVLSAIVRPGAPVDRLTELLHRAIPYPVLLFVSAESSLWLSLAHKRKSEAEAEVLVLDGDVINADLAGAGPGAAAGERLSLLALRHQRRGSLHALYDSWLDTACALLACERTGTLRSAGSREDAQARRVALAEYDRLQVESVQLRAAAQKERQMARLVDLNLELKRVEAAMNAAREKL